MDSNIVRRQINRIVKEEYLKYLSNDEDLQFEKYSTTHSISFPSEKGTLISLYLNSENPFIDYKFFCLVDEVKKRIVEEVELTFVSSNCLYDFYIMQFKI